MATLTFCQTFQTQTQTINTSEGILAAVFFVVNELDVREYMAPIKAALLFC